MNRQLGWIRCRDFKRLGGAEELFAIEWLLRRGLLVAGGNGVGIFEEMSDDKNMSRTQSE